MRDQNEMRSDKHFNRNKTFVMLPMQSIIRSDDDDLLPFLDLVEIDYFDVLPQMQVPQYYHREKGGRKRKRRCKNPSFMPEIRILRRDIRRRYGEMLLNVANAHEPSLFEKFVEDIFHPDCLIIRSNPAHNGASRLIVGLVFKKFSYNELVSGAKELLKEYSYHCEIVPDSVFHLQESYVRVKQGFGGSVVTAKLLTKGTQMFQIDASRLQLNCVPISTPIETMAEIGFVLILDEMNYIRQFHIESFTLSEKPVSVNENQ